MLGNRSVAVTLSANVAPYVAGMAKAKAATVDLAKSASRSATKNKADWDALGSASLITGAAIGLGVAAAARAYMSFEKAMSNVGAVADANATQMKALSEAALDAGAKTSFSATQAAEAEAELAKAGVSVTDILNGGLVGSMNLAAAGQIELGRSAEIAAQAMNIFKLSGGDVGHIADVLTAGANRSAAGVDDLGMALSQGGQVAQQMGLSLEDTVGGLAAFADRALKGSDAGTSLKTMLQRLAAPSGEARDTMRQLGISAFDASGQFVGLANFAGQLQSRMAGLSDEQRNAAMATIFGSDAVRSANVLYDLGAAGVEKYTAAVNDQGAAARMAKRQMDNLAGDVEQLRGSLETAFIKVGSGGNEGLRSLAQSATAAVNAFNDLSPATQSNIVKLAAFSAGALILGGAVAKAITTFTALRGAIAATGMSLDVVKTKAAATGVNLGAAAAGAKKLGVALVAAQIAGSAANAAMSDSFDTTRFTRGITSVSQATNILNSQIDNTGVNLGGLGDMIHYAFDPSALAKVDNWAAGMMGMSGSVDDAKQSLSALDSVMAGYVQKGDQASASNLFAALAKSAKEEGVSVDQLRAKLPQYTAALDTAATAGKDAASSVTDIADAAATAQGSISDLAGELRGFGSAAMSADEAAAAYQESLAELNAAAEKNGDVSVRNHRALGTATARQRESGRALRSFASATKEAAAAQFELTGSADGAAKKVALGRAKFIAAAHAMGLSIPAANRLADAYGLIPETVKTTLSSNAGAAAGQIRMYTTTVRGVPIAKKTVITTTAAQARSGVTSLRNEIANLRDKTIRITTVRTVIMRTKGSPGRTTTGGLTVDADGGMHLATKAGLVKAYADGGLWDDRYATTIQWDGTFGSAQPQIAPAGGRGVTWREDGAGPWEAFISGHPAKRDRSVAIWQDTGRRLGVTLSDAMRSAIRMADGGTLARATYSTPAASTAQAVPVSIDYARLAAEIVRANERGLTQPIFDAASGGLAARRTRNTAGRRMQ